MSVVGVVYVINKRTKKGSWVEYYVKISAPEARRLGLQHKQRVYVSTVEPTVDSTVGSSELLSLLVKLFLLCFKDEGLREQIVRDAERAQLVRSIVRKIRGESE